MITLSILSRYWLPLLLAIVSLLVTALDWNDLFQYDRSRLAAGQWWLLFSGHVAHLGWRHCILNVVALLIIWDLFFKDKSTWLSAVYMLGLMLCICAALYILEPQIHWYVGLSGLLHGLFAIGALREALKKRAIGIIAGIALCAKILYEQLIGPTTGFFVESNLIVLEAHCYGAVFGILIAGIESLMAFYRLVFFPQSRQK